MPNRLKNVYKNICPYLKNFTIYEALDGQSKKLEQKLYHFQIPPYMNTSNEMTRSTLGLLISFINILKKAETYDSICFFEDDVILAQDFEKKLEQIKTELPEKTDIVKLNLRFKPPYYLLEDHNIDTKYIMPYIIDEKKIPLDIYGGEALYITKRGIKKLLTYFKVLDTPLDIKIYHLIRNGKLNAYMTKNNNLCTQNKNLESNIIKKPYWNKVKQMIQTKQYKKALNLLEKNINIYHSVEIKTLIELYKHFKDEQKINTWSKKYQEINPK